MVKKPFDPFAFDRKPVPWSEAQSSQFNRVGRVRDLQGQYVSIWKNEDDAENKFLYAMHPMSKAMHQIPFKVAQRAMSQDS